MAVTPFSHRYPGEPCFLVCSSSGKEHRGSTREPDIPTGSAVSPPSELSLDQGGPPRAAGGLHQSSRTRNLRSCRCPRPPQGTTAFTSYLFFNSQCTTGHLEATMLMTSIGKGTGTDHAAGSLGDPEVGSQLFPSAAGTAPTTNSGQPPGPAAGPASL